MQLRDIRPLWDIQEYSLYILLIIICLVVVGGVLVFLYIKKLHTQKLQHILRQNINEFSIIDITTSKDFAYKSTKILHNIIYAFCIKPTKNPFIKKHSIEDISKITNDIESFISLVDKYKYKSNTQQYLDESIKKSYQNLTKELDAYL